MTGGSWLGGGFWLTGGSGLTGVGVGSSAGFGEGMAGASGFVDGIAGVASLMTGPRAGPVTGAEGSVGPGCVGGQRAGLRPCAGFVALWRGAPRPAAACTACFGFALAQRLTFVCRRRCLPAWRACGAADAGCAPAATQAQAARRARTVAISGEPARACIKRCMVAIWRRLPGTSRDRAEGDRGRGVGQILMAYHRPESWHPLDSPARMQILRSPARMRTLRRLAIAQGRQPSPGDQIGDGARFGRDPHTI